MPELVPGLFKVKTKQLLIRYEPRITSTNVMGMLNAGDQRQVFEFITHSDGSTWGRISQPDSHGKSMWICIKNINTIFMELVEPLVDTRPIISQTNSTDKIRLYVNDALVYSQN